MECTFWSLILWALVPYKQGLVRGPWETRARGLGPRLCRVKARGTGRSPERQDSVGGGGIQYCERRIRLGRLRKFGCLLRQSGILFQPKIHQTLKLGEVRELSLYQASENHGAERAHSKVSLGQPLILLVVGPRPAVLCGVSEAFYSFCCACSDGWPPFEPGGVQGLSLAHPGGSPWALLSSPPRDLVSRAVGISQLNELASAKLSPPYLPACLLAPPHPPRRNPERSPWGVWSHRNVALWPLAVECPGWTWPGKQEGLKGGGESAPWPLGGMEGKEAPGGTVWPPVSQRHWRPGGGVGGRLWRSRGILEGREEQPGMQKKLL